MTERKPPDMSFRSWIDQQINEAAERGAFEDLPGAGKPLPKSEEDAAQAWLREYVRREGVSTEEFLPVPLKLRKESERLADAAAGLPSGEGVRGGAAEPNGANKKGAADPPGPADLRPAGRSGGAGPPVARGAARRAA